MNEDDLGEGDFERDEFNPEVDSLSLAHSLADRVLITREKDTKKILGLEEYSYKKVFYSPKLMDEIFLKLKSVNPTMGDSSKMSSSEKWDYYLTLREKYLGDGRD